MTEKWYVEDLDCFAGATTIESSMKEIRAVQAPIVNLANLESQVEADTPRR
jgi:hypothetical protein